MGLNQRNKRRLISIVKQRLDQDGFRAAVYLEASRQGFEVEEHDIAWAVDRVKNPELYRRTLPGEGWS